MSLSNMASRGIGFGYKVLGEPARITPPGAPQASDVRVIFSLDGAGLLDGMMQSIGPSLRIRVSEAPGGVVARGTVFELPERGDLWKAREPGVLINDGMELQVQLGKA